MPKEFAELGQGMLGITYPVYVMVAIAIVLWYFLERTSAGRRIYAVGGNLEGGVAVRVRTSRVIITTLVICGIVASLAGVLLTARLANAGSDPWPAAPFSPAFTAAFLGSTQFGGRFEHLGHSSVSIYVLALGVKGLQLAGAQPWITDAFNGAALLAAVALAVSQKSAGTQCCARQDPSTRPARRVAHVCGGRAAAQSGGEAMRFGSKGVLATAIALTAVGLALVGCSTAGPEPAGLAAPTAGSAMSTARAPRSPSCSKRRASSPSRRRWRRRLLG